MTFVADLEPKALWAHFDRLLSLPRGSGREDAARRYVLEVAERNGCAVRSDERGNIVVRKAASGGGKEAPTVILQSHLDMVQERRPDVDHDFDRDPIVPRREGDYLYASGTTLGADNGLGVAAMLAVLEDTALEHPPLELLFTVDEERGLLGAADLDGTMLTGRRLLNLDSEEEGVLYVGCAGGGDSVLTLPIERAPAPADHVALVVEVGGLRGGHSGMDIVLQRGNALVILARLLRAAADGAPRVASLSGGGARNAIPRDAAAVVLVPASARAAAVAAFEREFAGVRAELRTADPGVTLSVAEAATPEATWSAALSETVLRLLVALPHGVLAMSHDLPGLVETSSNVAVVSEAGERLTVVTNQRSSVASALEAARARVRAVAELANAAIEQPRAYPGWQPDLASPLLEVVKAVHRGRAGVDPGIRAVHAGLECGIIGEKVPGLDMLSFGPQIEHPHSPDERARIPSVGPFYELLTATLARLARP